MVRASEPGARWISRSEWGAAPSESGYRRHRPARLVIHHTASPKIGDFSGNASVRAIQEFHQTTREWDDIGYHFVIAPDGRIYEGRPPLAEGAHVKKHNRGSIGIAVIGNFEAEEDRVPAAAWKALVRVCRLLVDRYAIPPGEIYGHRDFNAETACPGQRLYDRLVTLRREAAR